jgi:sugar lactone lactonase YvrE
LAFDGQGNLWVVDSQATRLLEYTALEQETGGSPVDTVSLAGIVSAGATWAPIAVAFDPHGNFWISARPRTLPPGPAADSVPSEIVAEFSDSTIKAGGTPAPVLIVTQSGIHPGGYGPGITFDAAGNLWTANANLGTVTSFAAASLTAGAGPTPTITISGSMLQGVADIAFDAAGVLYAGGGAYGSPGAGIFVFSPPEASVSGSPTPKLAFSPAAGVSHFAIR